MCPGLRKIERKLKENKVDLGIDDDQDGGRSTPTTHCCTRVGLSKSTHSLSYTEPLLSPSPRLIRLSTLSSALPSRPLLPTPLPPPPAHPAMTERYLGVTPPISTSPPTARDLEVSKTLIEELKTRGIYENPQEGRNRYTALLPSLSVPSPRTYSSGC